MDQVLACRSEEGMSVPVILSQWQSSNPSIWTEQDMHLMQDSMREGVLSVKDKGRTPARRAEKAWALGPGAEMRATKPVYIFLKAFPEFSMFPKHLKFGLSWSLKEVWVSSSTTEGRRASISLTYPGICPCSITVTAAGGQDY